MAKKIQLEGMKEFKKLRAWSNHTEVTAIELEVGLSVSRTFPGILHGISVG
jgi:hypothetical protein